MRNLIILAILGTLAALISLSCSQKYEPPTAPTTVHDTLVDTIFVTDTLPPVVDTLIKYDTSYIHVYDTTYLPGDTVYVLHVDTLMRYDTTYVPVIVHDTITVVRTDTLYVPVIVHDTVTIVRTDTVFVYDTLYVHDPCYKYCHTWEINVSALCTTVTMENVAGRYLLGFDRTRLDPKPDSLEFVVEAGGKVKFFTTYGSKTDLEWIGPVDLPASAVVKIYLKKPYYGNGVGKVASPLCWKYLSGKCFWLVKTKI